MKDHIGDLVRARTTLTLVILEIDLAMMDHTRNINEEVHTTPTLVIPQPDTSTGTMSRELAELIADKPQRVEEPEVVNKSLCKKGEVKQARPLVTKPGLT